jgi:hypothetical protein
MDWGGWVDYVSMLELDGWSWGDDLLILRWLPGQELAACQEVG